MWETDLAKSLPAARCEMDPGTVTGKAQPRQASVGPSRSPARLPACQAEGSPSLPPYANTAGSRRQEPQGIQAVGRRGFSVQPEGCVNAAQPFHQAFIRLVLPKQSQTRQEHPSPLLCYNKPTTGRGSLS